MATPVEFLNNYIVTTSSSQNECDWTSFSILDSNDMNVKIWPTLRNNIGSAYGGNNANGVFDNTRTAQITINHRKLDIKYVNRSNSQVTLKWYECVVRRDIPSGVSQTLNPELDTSLAANSSINGETKMQTNNLNFTLFDDSLFCQYYKIKRVWTEKLELGQEGYISLNYGRCYYRPCININLDETRGLTYKLFCQISGPLARSSTLGAITRGIAQASVDFYCKESYAAYFSENPSQNAVVTNDIQTLTTPIIWNAVTGLPETVAEA